jgi:hypothetical protein
MLCLILIVGGPGFNTHVGFGIEAFRIAKHGWTLGVPPPTALSVTGAEGSQQTR